MKLLIKQIALLGLTALAFLPSCALERSGGSKLRIHVSDSSGRELRSGSSSRSAALFDSSGGARSTISKADAKEVACFFVGVTGAEIKSSYRASDLPGVKSDCSGIDEMGQVSSLVSFSKLKSDGVNLSLSLGTRKFVLYAVNMRGFDSSTGCPVTTLAEAFKKDSMLSVFAYAGNRATLERQTTQINLSLVTESQLSSWLPSSCYDNAIAAPSNLAATAVSSSQINVTWNDDSTNETGFYLERSPTGISGWSTIATLGANVTSYNDTGLNLSTTYYYRISSYHSAATMTYATLASATTGNGIPTAFIATKRNEGAIQLTWVDKTSTETEFRIETSLNETTWTEIAVPAADAQLYNHTGLIPAKRYFYRIRAITPGGNSAYSTTANATTDDGIPTLPNASATDHKRIQLTWQDRSANDLGFEIEVSPNQTDWTPVFTTAANATSYEHGGLIASKRYYYRIRALHSGGPSLYALTDTTTSAFPGMPTNLTLTANSDTEIAFAWTDNHSAAGDSYAVSLSQNQTNWDPIPLSPSQRSGTKGSLTQGTLYYFKVVMTSPDGTAPDLIASGYTKFTAPTGLTVTAVANSASKLDLAWTDNSTGEAGFLIERGTDGVTFGTNVTTTSANATSYQDTGLAAETRYYYRISAVKTGRPSSTGLTGDGTTNSASAEWIATSVSADTPSARFGHTAVWTGTKMIVWGGRGNGGVNDNFATGSMYDPVNNTWTSMATAGAPTARAYHTAVWTDSKMIVWGGEYTASGTKDDGGMFVPGEGPNGTWYTMDSTDPPPARSHHSAVWTGAQMIIFGGQSAFGKLNDAHYFDPAAGGPPGSWTLMAPGGAPTGRIKHTAIWNSYHSKMWVFGGLTATGSVRDVFTVGIGESWLQMNGDAAVYERQRHSAVFAPSNNRMIVWGGCGIASAVECNFNPSIGYDFDGTQWVSLSVTNQPTPVHDHKALWATDKNVMVVWGGAMTNGTKVSSGGLYHTGKNAWATLPEGGASLPARTGHTMVSAAPKICIWGGMLQNGSTTNTGACYDITEKANGLADSQ